MSEYFAKKGDSINNIAFRFGLYWETIWNHDKNTKLRELRKYPDLLHEGDVVFIPEKKMKYEKCEVNRKNRFIVNFSERLNLTLLDEEEPVKNEAYILEIDYIINGEKRTKYDYGKTDENGKLEEHILPPNATIGRLAVGPDEDKDGNQLQQDKYVLKLHHLPPIDTLAGVQSRLKNLGFNCDLTHNPKEENIKTAVRAFQERYRNSSNGINVNGKYDDPKTQEELRKIYGC